MRYTKEKMREIYLQWQQSGLSRKAFCKEHHIAYGTFQHWIKRLSSSDSSGFTEIALKPSAEVFFEVIFPSGARMTFQREPSVSWLRELVY
jgi:transposase-like protein